MFMDQILTRSIRAVYCADMTERSYNQYCGLATALDVVGERWSMLLVRNLLVGPQRFSDLRDALPGLSTGLLSSRLKGLEQSGVVTKTPLPPPAASTVYQLTRDGRRLAPAVLELARWGMGRLGSADGRHYDASTLMVGLWAQLDGVDVDAALPDGDIAVTVDGRPFDITTEGGATRVVSGAPAVTVASVTTDSATLAHLSDGSETLAEAVTDGRLEVKGQAEPIAALTTALGLAR